MLRRTQPTPLGYAQWVSVVVAGILVCELLLMSVLAGEGIAAAQATTPDNSQQQTLQALAAATLNTRRTLTAAVNARPTNTPDLDATLGMMVALTETAQSGVPSGPATTATTSAGSAPPAITATAALINMTNPPSALVISPQNVAQITEWKTLAQRSDWLAVSPDGKMLATGSYEGIAFYDLPTLSLISMIAQSNTQSAAFSADWKTVVVADSKVFRLGEIGSGALQPLDILGGAEMGSVSIALTPNGQLLAAAIGKAIKIVDLPAKRVLKTIPSSDSVRAVAFSPDGKFLVAPLDEKLQVLDTTTWKTVRQMEQRNTEYLAFSRDGKRLASRDIWGQMIIVWETQNWKQSVSLKLEKDDAWVFKGVAFSPGKPDTLLVATAMKDATIKLWDAKTGRLLTALAGHTSGVTAVAFVPNGTALVSVSEDGTIKVWGLPAQ